MKNKKFHGTIKEQYFRTKSKPLIAEVKPDKNEDVLKNSNENKPNDDSKSIKQKTTIINSYLKTDNFKLNY